MARVNVDDIALTDPRFAALGKLLNLDRWSALGRMVLVWNLCTERGCYVLDRESVNLLFNDVDGFSEALLKSGLGKKHRHGIYIAGSKGHIEWLENKRRANRENGKKGGRPRKTETKPTENPRGFPAETTLALAPALAPDKNPFLSEVKSLRTTVKKSFDVNSPEYQLATFLFTAIQERNPGHRAPDLQKWAVHVDRMIRLDGREPAEIRGVIEWSQASDFWQNNILSTEKLREQFDQLKLKSRPAKARADRERPEGRWGVEL